MKLRLALLCGLIMILPLSSIGQKPQWLAKIKQVKLLSDTYDDVIKIMGNPANGNIEKKLSAYFDLDEGRIYAIFASGLCVVTPYSGGEPIGWKVPEWTVIDISFRPKKPISPKKLNVDFTGFRKSSIEDVPGAFILRNDELGIEYALTREGKIEDIEFFPPSKFNNLLCQ